MVSVIIIHKQMLQHIGTWKQHVLGLHVVADHPFQFLNIILLSFFERPDSVTLNRTFLPSDFSKRVSITEHQHFICPQSHCVVYDDKYSRFLDFAIQAVFDHYRDGAPTALFGLFLADGVCNGLCLWPSLCRSQSILVQNNPHHLLSPLLHFSAYYLSVYPSLFPIAFLLSVFSFSISLWSLPAFFFKCHDPLPPTFSLSISAMSQSDCSFFLMGF